LQIEIACRIGEAALIEGGDGRAGAQTCQGLFDCGANFELEGWQVQQCVKDKPNLIPVESVLPPSTHSSSRATVLGINTSWPDSI
jgi:hypothetical protein